MGQSLRRRNLKKPVVCGGIRSKGTKNKTEGDGERRAGFSWKNRGGGVAPC